MSERSDCEECGAERGWNIDCPNCMAVTGHANGEREAKARIRELETLLQSATLSLYVSRKETEHVRELLGETRATESLKAEARIVAWLKERCQDWQDTHDATTNLGARLSALVHITEVESILEAISDGEHRK